MPFGSCSFAIDGFDAAPARILRAHIVNHHATLVHLPSDLPASPSSTNPNKNFLILPLVCSAQLLRKTHAKANAINIKIATDIWLENCIHENKLLDIDSNIFFEPFAPPRIPALISVRVSFSGFDDYERYPLEKLLEAFGAVVSDSLVRNETKFLVCKSPNGRKFEKAIEWAIATVSPDWISQIAVKNCYVSYEEFLVCPLQVLLGTRIFITPSTPSLRQTRTLARTLGATVLHAYSARSCTHVVHLPAAQPQGTGQSQFPNAQTMPPSSPVIFGASSISITTRTALRAARADAKHVVPPAWLQECSKEGRRLKETDFPVHFNTQRMLSLTASSSPICFSNKKSTLGKLDLAPSSSPSAFIANLHISGASDSPAPGETETMSVSSEFDPNVNRYPKRLCTMSTREHQQTQQQQQQQIQQHKLKPRYTNTNNTTATPDREKQNNEDAVAIIYYYSSKAEGDDFIGNSETVQNHLDKEAEEEEEEGNGLNHVSFNIASPPAQLFLAPDRPPLALNSDPILPQIKETHPMHEETIPLSKVCSPESEFTQLNNTIRKALSSLNSTKATSSPRCLVKKNPPISSSSSLQQQQQKAEDAKNHPVHCETEKPTRLKRRSRRVTVSYADY